jgi:hypothetical protein
VSRQENFSHGFVIANEKKFRFGDSANVLSASRSCEARRTHQSLGEDVMKGFAEKFRAIGRCILVVLVAVMLSPPASATVVASSGTIVTIITYPNYGNGDFTFRLSSQPAGCYGFWVSPSQPGFTTTIAYILKAHAAGESIVAGGDNAQIWGGSGSSYCKLDYVGTPY